MSRRRSVDAASTCIREGFDKKKYEKEDVGELYVYSYVLWSLQYSLCIKVIKV